MIAKGNLSGISFEKDICVGKTIEFDFKGYINKSYDDEYFEELREYKDENGDFLSPNISLILCENPQRYLESRMQQDELLIHDQIGNVRTYEKSEHLEKSVFVTIADYISEYDKIISAIKLSKTVSIYCCFDHKQKIITDYSIYCNY